MNKEYVLQSRHIRKAWQSLGSPEIRTAVECAVGPYPLILPLKESSEKMIFIEPNPKLARAARKHWPWAEIHQVGIGPVEESRNLRILHGQSYIKGIKWAPVFSTNPKKARRGKKVAVKMVRFSSIDDGRIDVLNLDMEGSEWYVLMDLASRPMLIQIELYKRNGYYREICSWLKRNDYHTIAKWGNANRILRRREPKEGT